MAILLCALLALVPAAMAGCGDGAATTDGGRDYYLVKYDLNYDGGSTRNVSVAAGKTATAWRATRDEYDLVGWYVDREGTTAYDFSERVNSDRTIYAAWKAKPGMATVTFDFGVAGKENKTLATRKENKIAEKYVPSYKPFGMTLTGWYKDENKTAKWDFATDTVEGDTTLYAGYEYTSAVERNADGSVKYDNVTVNVWVNSGSNAFNSVLMSTLAERFNAEYDGKIKVEVSTKLTSQSDTFLRLQETRQIIHTAATYYPIGEIYNFAGIDMKNSDWYEKAVREICVDGSYIQVPLAGVVPYFVYNKSLTAKYSDGKLPTNYAELSALLKKAYDGEIATNSGFKGIIGSSGWTYKEAPSMAAFLQNGAPYYVYENADTFNNWSEPAVRAKAERALGVTYELFGKNSAFGGGLNSDLLSASIAKVNDGNALMTLNSWIGNEKTIAQSANLGVLPMAGLMTDENSEYSGDTPIFTLGLGFYNGATNVLADPVRVCASAVFADWLSRNAYEFSAAGYVPLHKAAATSEAFVNSEDEVTNFIKTVFDYENLATLYGHTAMKTVVNVKAAEETIIPFLSTDGTGAAETIESLRTKIAELVY